MPVAASEIEEFRRSVERFLADASGGRALAASDVSDVVASLTAAGLVPDPADEDLLVWMRIVVEASARQEGPAFAIALARALAGDDDGALRAAGIAAAARRALDEATAFAQARQTFGRPIAKHQVVKHMLARMAADTLAVQALVERALSTPGPGSGTVAEAVAVEIGWDIFDTALQIFGGSGYARGSWINRAWSDMAVLRPSRRSADRPRLPRPDDRAELRGRVRSFVGSALAPNADRWEADEAFPRDVFAAAGRAGLFAHKFSPEVGGCGPDLIADAVVTEEVTSCGSGGVAASLGAHKDLACLYLASFGTAEQRQRWLRPAIAGEAIGAFAVTEPDAGSDVAAIRTSARRDGDGWVLNGSKVFITNGAWADLIVVAARTGPGEGHAGISLFVVERGDPGFASRRMPMLGWRPSQTGELTFTDVRVPDDRRLGEVGGGFYAIMQNFAWERIVMAVAQAASGERLLELSWGDGRSDLLWALNLRHQAARALTDRALEELVGGGSPMAEVAMAKLLTSESALEAARHAVVTAAEEDARERADRALRDLRLGPIGGGTSEIMKEIIARLLGL